MTKLLSCRYNMDTNRVEARFEDGVRTDGAERGDGALSFPRL